MAQVAKPTTGGGVNGGKFQDKDKPMEVRMSNITAAKGNIHTRQIILMISRSIVSNTFYIAVGDAIRTSLGPRGMDKMVNVKNN